MGFRARYSLIIIKMRFSHNFNLTFLSATVEVRIFVFSVIARFSHQLAEMTLKIKENIRFGQGIPKAFETI